MAREYKCPKFVDVHILHQYAYVHAYGVNLFLELKQAYVIYVCVYMFRKVVSELCTGLRVRTYILYLQGVKCLM